MKLNINSKAVKEQTDRLRTLHRSALPNAVRNTLNDAAIDVKKNTMPESAKKTFIERKPTFFKANSKIDYATGYDVNSMKATVGFFSNNLKGSNNYAVKDLEEQEGGGTIDKKSFIPLPTSRKGNSINGLVKPNNRLAKIKERGIINARNSKGKNIKEKFIKSAVAAGKGGYVISGKNKILFRVDSYQSNFKSKRTSIKVTPLYTFRRNRKVTVKSTNFMKTASLKSADKMNAMFIKQANIQIERLRK